jgi:hypothetical protein
MSREDIIWAVWDERGVYAWRAETHGRGLEPLVIQGPPLPPHDVLEFRLEFAAQSGRPYHAIVCEGVIVEKIERY